MDERAVVTGFLYNDGEILLLERSDSVGSYRGCWGGIAGHVEDHTGPETADPFRSAVRAEIREETGIDPDSLSLVRAGDPFTVSDTELGTRWTVYPFLLDSPTRAVELDCEHTAFEWVAPTAILDRETVLRLWESYDRVRPTVRSIENDRDHGAAYLSLRALDVLRDEARLLASDERESGFDDVSTVASALIDARPSMIALTNRINRAVNRAESDPNSVVRTAIEEIERASAADDRAAANLRPRLDGARVATLSRSGTVLQAIREATPEAVLVAESRPGGEGVDVAEQLAPGLAVTMTTDAAFPGQLRSWGADLLVVGADAVLPDGAVRNKVGTHPAAAVASRAAVPVVVATAVDKVSPVDTDHPELRPGKELYDGEAAIDPQNPTFERTPSELIDAYVTDRGEVDETAIRSLADEFSDRAGWQE